MKNKELQALLTRFDDDVEVVVFGQGNRHVYWGITAGEVTLRRMTPEMVDSVEEFSLYFYPAKENEKKEIVLLIGVSE